jgi:hypothetical protein
MGAASAAGPHEPARRIDGFAAARTGPRDRRLAFDDEDVRLIEAFVSEALRDESREPGARARCPAAGSCPSTARR